MSSKLTECTTARPGSTPAVPAWIDATGKTDASWALQSFVDSVPDGSTIEFRAGGTYRMDAGLALENRNDLTSEGNGATLRSAGGSEPASSLFVLRWNNGITIREFSLVGNDPKDGTSQAYREWVHGILLRGGSDVEIANVAISGAWGDCLYVSGWADTVSFHDSTCASSGRNGIAITAGKNVVERRAFGIVGGVGSSSRTTSAQ